MLDLAFALWLEPAAHDTEAREKAITALTAPLPGSDESRKAAKAGALAAMGITPSMIGKAAPVRPVTVETADT